MAAATVILYCPAANASGAVAFTAPNNVEARDDVDAQFRVGGHYIDAKAGKRYMYVKFDNGVGNVAAAAGNLAYVHTLAGWDPETGLAQVTSDQSDSLGGGAATTSIVAGVFVNVITDLRFGFIQVGGKRTGVNVAATIIAGDSLVSSATDGQAGEYAGTEISVPFAVSLNTAV